MGVKAGQAALYRVTVDVGDKMDAPPGPGIAEGGYGQAHAPVAAADADMNDVAPASFGVSRLDEFNEPLPLRCDFRHGSRCTQSGVPRGTVFSRVDEAAFQQETACLVEAPCLQKGRGRLLQ